MSDGQVVDDHEQYSVVLREDEQALVQSWKNVVGLSVADDRAGVRRFAAHCVTYEPVRAVIDVTRVVDRAQVADEEEFVPWWTREIVPSYHEAGISGLAIVTGDPNAPGETGEVPPGVKFKLGYFADLDSALRWDPR
ncbi:MAG: hypothetical protein ACRDNB_01305 [Gaiellaceae bacterium]